VRVGCDSGASRVRVGCESGADGVRFGCESGANLKGLGARGSVSGPGHNTEMALRRGMNRLGPLSAPTGRPRERRMSGPESDT
jgi:hypothetical protein